MVGYLSEFHATLKRCRYHQWFLDIKVLLAVITATLFDNRFRSGMCYCFWFFRWIPSTIHCGGLLDSYRRKPFIFISAHVVIIRVMCDIIKRRVKMRRRRSRRRWRLPFRVVHCHSCFVVKNQKSTANGIIERFGAQQFSILPRSAGQKSYSLNGYVGKKNFLIFKKLFPVKRLRISSIIHVVNSITTHPKRRLTFSQRVDSSTDDRADWFSPFWQLFFAWTSARKKFNFVRARRGTKSQSIIRFVSVER